MMVTRAFAYRAAVGNGRGEALLRLFVLLAQGNCEIAVENTGGISTINLPFTISMTSATVLPAYEMVVF